MKRVLKIHTEDKVAVALEDLVKGDKVQVEEDIIEIKEPIKKGHKIALVDFEIGVNVIKYGESIGITTKTIAQGEWVHTHNMTTGLGDLLTYTYEPNLPEEKKLPKRTFKGFIRPDGRVGIRNEIWIIPTVGCVNSVAKKLEEEMHALRPEGVDGVYAYTHPYGCSQLGEDHENTRKILVALAKHPNAAGVLVLGLGCENNTIQGFKELLGEYDTKGIKFLETQKVEDEIEEAKRYIEELMAYAKTFKREETDMSKLVVGLKCGGSDGYSGITANPMVGRFTEQVVAHEGSAILTEVPEMFGAETLLMERCETRKEFEEAVELINRFKTYFKASGMPIYENPSPGNKDGGITTLEDKSLGCIQKGGRVVIKGILDYGETLITPGLNLLYGPGNDLVSTTAMAAAGAQIILFTTGRGTPFGAPVPTVKISTNTELYKKKSNWMDFNAGEIATGRSIDEVASDFMTYIEGVISGEQLTLTEINNYREIAIFKNGITL